MPRVPLLAALAAATVSASAHASVTYDFNVSQADTNLNFTYPTNGFGGNAGTVGEWVPTDGVGNSGWLDADSTFRSAYSKTSPGTFTSAGNAATVGIRFKFRGTGVAAGSAHSNITVGFNLLNTSSLVASTGATMVFATINTFDVPAEYDDAEKLQISYVNGGSATVIDHGKANSFQMTADGWYELKLTLTYNGSNQFAASTTLFDWGSNGQTGGSIVRTYAPTAFNLSGFVNQSIFAGVGAVDSSSGGTVRGLDNFTLSPIPEPATLALGALGLLLLAPRRRAA